MSWLSSLPKQPTERILCRRHTPLEGEPVPLTGTDFQDGSFLCKFAKNCVRKATTLFGRPLIACSTQNIGSVCTGSAMDAMAVSATEAALRAEDIPADFDFSFTCETEKNKANFIAQIIPKVLPCHNGLPCNFQLLENFAHPDKRKCGVHNRPCKLPSSLHGLIGGLSCKDWARMKNWHSGPKQNGAAIYGADKSPGKSAECMHGLIATVKACPTDWVILENSDELTENEQQRPALDLFMHDLNEAGFDARIFTVQSSDYALPQKRRRAWICAVRRPSQYLYIKD